ncbi:MAG: hypothetical protein WCP21_01775 [Armatimonadota bacterium]
MRIAISVMIAVLFVVMLAGCSGGGGVPTVTLGSDPVTSPPVGTAAVSPTVAKFGPVANYLPPSGTIINYGVSSLMSMKSRTVRLQFVSYDNVAGTMVLDIQDTSEEGPSHSRFTFWVKPISGQSYCYKRKKVFYDEVRTAETSTFTPGVLMGLFSSTPASVNVTFNEAGHSTGSHTYTEKYLGNATVVAGTTTYSNCVISETSKFMPGDVAKIAMYWAPNKGPIMAALSPAISIKGLTVRLPRWCSMSSAKVTSVTTAD